MKFFEQKNINTPDEELLNHFQKENDLEILGVLYNRYMHLVYGVCLKYLKNKEDSKDAVIQIFEILIKEVPKHEIQVFKSWLYGVTRNFCLMKLRSDTAKKNKILSLESDFFMETPQEVHPIDKEEINLDSRLRKCLENLKLEQQKCIQLFYYSKNSYREIAEELQLEEKKVKSFIQNGKRNLKICLEQKEKVYHD